MDETINKKFVITIGRQRGSGGRTVGKELARRFGIHYYDREILTVASHELGSDEEYLATLDERSINVIHNIFPTAYDSLSFQYLPTSAELIGVQTRLIREFGQRHSCVIVGRCADYVLRDMPNVTNIFLTADPADREARISRIYGISETEARKQIKRMDSERAKYYRSQTGQYWGNSANYHLCVNTSKLGVNETCDVVEKYVRQLLSHD